MLHAKYQYLKKNHYFTQEKLINIDHIYVMFIIDKILSLVFNYKYLLT